MEIAGIECSGIEVFTAKPGDVVFVSVDGALTDVAAARITARLKELLPDGVKCGVLQDGMKLHVIRPENEAIEPDRKVNFREFT